MTQLEMAMILAAQMLDYALSVVFLLPIKDDRGRHRAFPYMTASIVVLNTLVFVGVNIVLGMQFDDAEAWFNQIKPFMLVPADIIERTGLGAVSVITSTFLHADWDHLAYNMLFLVFFGRKLEDVLGPAKFGLFYLACTFVSSMGSMAQELFQLPVTHGDIPGLGASGALMGVMAAYLFLYPGQRIRTWPTAFWTRFANFPLSLPIPVPIPLSLPVWVFILHSILKNLVHGWLQVKAQEYGFVYSLIGSFAHLGGIVAGLTCIYFFLPAEILHYRHRVGESVD